MKKLLLICSIAVAFTATCFAESPPDYGPAKQEIKQECSPVICQVFTISAIQVMPEIITSSTADVINASPVLKDDTPSLIQKINSFTGVSSGIDERGSYQTLNDVNSNCTGYIDKFLVWDHGIKA